MTDVASPYTATWMQALPAVQTTLRLSSGRRVALLEGADAHLYVASSPDGAVWTAPAQTAMTIPNLRSLVQVGDALSCWQTGLSIQHNDVPLDPATGAPGALVNGGQPNVITGATFSDVQAVWDTANTLYHIVYSYPHQAGMVITMAAVTPARQVLSTMTLAVTASAIACLSVQRGPSGFVYVAYYDQALGAIRLLPVVWQSGSYAWTPQTAETVAVTGVAQQFGFYVDPAGVVWFIVSQGGALYAVQRIYAKTYSGAQPLQGSIVAGTLPRITRDPATGNLSVIYETAANQPAGELYVVPSSAGTWLLPRVLAGGDAQGYHAPSVSPSYVGGVADVVFQRGAGGTVVYLPLALAGPPAAPAITSPAGDETSLAPQICATYANSSPTDPMGGRQIQVTDQGSGVLLWDSGDLAGVIACTAYGGAALSYDTTYLVRARDKDSQTGVYGPWSASTPFTPRQGGTVTIQSITSHGTTTTASPSTLPAPTFSAQVGWTHPQGHGASGYRMRVVAADGVTPIASTTTLVLSPAIASGGSFGTQSWTVPGLANGVAASIILDVVDASSGLISSSAPWPITTAWAGPDPVTGLTFSDDPLTGIIRLAWTAVDPATVSLLVTQERRRDDGTYEPAVVLSSGILWPNWMETIWAATRQVYRYTVYAIAANGLRSVGATVLGVLRVQGQLNAWWANALDDPFNDRAAFGAFDDLVTILERDQQVRGVESLAYGALAVRALFDVSRWSIYGGNSSASWWLPRSSVDLATGTIIYGENTRETLRRMAGPPRPVVFRESVRGEVLVVTLLNFKDAVTTGVTGFTVTFDIHQLASDAPIPVRGG